jgi:DNA-binding MarR family transcriptional regulator
MRSRAETKLLHQRALDTLRELGESSTVDLAPKLGLLASEAQTVLHRMLQLGLIQRRRKTVARVVYGKRRTVRINMWRVAE